MPASSGEASEQPRRTRNTDLRRNALHLVLAHVLLDGADEVRLLSTSNALDALVIHDLAQLLHAQLVEVHRVQVDLLLVRELTHLTIHLLEARSKPLSVDASGEGPADFPLDTTRSSLRCITNAHVVAHGLVLTRRGVTERLHLSLNLQHIFTLIAREAIVELAQDRSADCANADGAWSWAT